MAIGLIISLRQQRYNTIFKFKTYLSEAVSEAPPIVNCWLAD